MQTAQELERKIASAHDLQSVVKTMKALAAASIRQYERAVESLAEYFRTIELGFLILLRSRPEVLSMLETAREGRLLAVVFGSDYGMAGQFNDTIADYAVKRMRELGEGEEEWTVWAVGGRAEDRVARTGQTVGERFAVPNSVTTITRSVQEILSKIEDWRSAGTVKQVVLFHHRPISGASSRPQELQLLPLDRNWFRSMGQREWPGRTLPTFTMDPVRLMSSLVRQFLFVSLYRAFAESLAAENASRLTSMQAAEKNISDRLAELRVEYQMVRQSNITAELMDIVSGFEALTGPGG